MKISLADPTGFCFGVQRAINALETALSSADGGAVVSIGMPIHNPQEVERLKKLGLVVVENVLQIPKGATVFIRAHGEPMDVYNELLKNGYRIIDATCPFVKRVQDKAAELTEAGYSVVLLGDGDHPEVRSIVGHCADNIKVVKTPAEAEEISTHPQIGVISQTTQREEDFEQLVNILRRKTNELEISDTICQATVERQQAVRKLADSVEGIIIVGGKNSANTVKLYEIAKSRGTDAILVESSKELDGGWLKGKSSIGVAAGASTPEWLIVTICKAVAKMTAG
ncbi:MAG: 4-hydroxy-3-methylbut-2-enyl diphosphate reductase [Synergistaceae bacterium]|nr:4-hydroxy-3-methylbut-2-enyl diphosphate reductase [Synergistaceae bacterium]